jgi:hypothetical protein
MEGRIAAFKAYQRVEMEDKYVKLNNVINYSNATCKVNIRLLLCLTRHHAVKAYGGMEIWFHILTSALNGGGWSASRPCRFTLGERTPGTHWIRGWVDPRAGLDAVAKRKTPSPRRKSNPDHPHRPACSLVAIQTELSPLIQKKDRWCG